MEKKIGYSILLAIVMVLGSFGQVSAGVEPSPFEPEINKLHSIELNVAAINKRIAKFEEMEPLPDGWHNYLSAMANQMEALSVRAAETLAVLPSPSLGNPYDGQFEVILSLDGIKLDSVGINDIIDKISARMGVEPSPFKIGSIRIIQDIDFHLIPISPPLP